MTSLSADGRVSIPRKLRDALGLRPGHKVVWSLLSDGRVVLRPKTRNLIDLAGCLTREGQPSVTIGEMSL